MINFFCSGFEDFDSSSKIILFSPGSAVGSINCASFSIVDDEIQESEEFFTVAADRNDLFNVSVARMVIQDNDGRFFCFHLFLFSGDYERGSRAKFEVFFYSVLALKKVY